LYNWFGAGGQSATGAFGAGADISVYFCEKKVKEKKVGSFALEERKKGRNGRGKEPGKTKRS
jgi:hypothetical protein